MGQVLKAAFLFAGTIIGAGVLALPSVIAETGLIYGTAIIFGVGALIALAALMFGEVVLRTRGVHQLPGLARKYAGKRASQMAVIFSILGIYGGLIAYIHGSALVINQFFGLSPFLAKLIFFVPVTFVTYYGIKGVEESEGFLTGLLVLCLLAMSAGALFFYNPSNVTTGSIANILLPIGVLVFALEGLPAIPQMNEILSREKKGLKKSIIIGISIPILLYALFCFASIGALGTNVGEVATMGLAEYGRAFYLLGGIFALLAMSTGFISFSNAVAETYSKDLKINRKLSWALACFVPLIALFASNIILPSLDFATLIAYTGVLFTGPYYLIVIYTFYKARQLGGDRKPEYELRIPSYLTGMMMLVFLAFSMWAFWTTLSPLI
ncbi:MAG: hypothetical protein JW727_02480 [Candidatus Aenigmarchaeota archaeon]|nr:hypothetical protein [Candidatus Aenigmarchaeota archaeon]